MSDPKARARRLWLYLPWTIAGLVFLAYLAAWISGAAAMKRAVARWVDDQTEAGALISYESVKADGFPFFLRVHVDRPDIAFPDSGVRWRTERLTIDALPYDPGRLVFSVRSDQHYELGSYGDWRVEARDFRTSIASDKERRWKFALTISGANAQRTDGASASLGNLVLDAAPTAANNTIIGVSLAAQNTSATIRERRFRLDTLQTAVAASHAHFLGDLTAWNRAGGMMVVNGFIAQLGDSSIALSGELALDQHVRPEGVLQTEVISPAGFVRLLADTGVIEEADVESIASTFTLAAIAGGGKLTAPVFLKDGTVEIAGVKIAELAPID